MFHDILLVIARRDFHRGIPESERTGDRYGIFSGNFLSLPSYHYGIITRRRKGEKLPKELFIRFGARQRASPVMLRFVPEDTTRLLDGEQGLVRADLAFYGDIGEDLRQKLGIRS